MTLLENIIISKIANKMYPYLLEKNVVEINKQEKKGIFDNVKSLLFHLFRKH